MFALLNLLHSQTFQYKTLDTTLSLCTPSSHRSHFRQIKPVEFKYNKMETFQALSLHMCVQSQRKCQFFCYSLFRLANGFRRTGGQFRTMPTVCWRVRRMLPAACLPDAALTCPFCPLPIKTSITALENVGIANSIAILVLSLPVFSLALLFCHKWLCTARGRNQAQLSQNDDEDDDDNDDAKRHTITSAKGHSFESARVKRSKEASGNAGRQSAGIHF